MSDHKHHYCQPDYRGPIVAAACCKCGNSVALDAINLDATPRTLLDRLREVWRSIVLVGTVSS